MMTNIADIVSPEIHYGGGGGGSTEFYLVPMLPRVGDNFLLLSVSYIFRPNSFHIW